MKQKLKLSRGKQTAGLLALTALLLCLFWGFLGYPFPTEEMEFRRLERQYGMPPSQIVLHIPKKMEREQYIVPQNRWCENQGAQFIGIGDGHAVCGVVCWRLSSEGGTLRMLPLEEQKDTVKLAPVLIPFYEWRRAELPGLESCGIVLLDVPEGAVEVEMTVQCNGESLTHRVGPLEGGGWLVSFPPVKEEDGFYDLVGSDTLLGVPYEMKVYDQMGYVLHTQSGTVPDSWR